MSPRIHLLKKENPDLSTSRSQNICAYKIKPDSVSHLGMKRSVDYYGSYLLLAGQVSLATPLSLILRNYAICNQHIPNNILSPQVTTQIDSFHLIVTLVVKY